MKPSIAVVTGAAGDIGRAIAKRLGTSHDLVFLVDIDENAAARAVADLGDGARFRALACDVTNEKSVAAMAKSVMSAGDIRTLVNNAGAARAVSLHDTTPEIWRQDNALNLEAVFLCFRALEDGLKQTAGSVVNISSVNGMAVFGHPAYSAAKAGLIHLTRLIAVEYGKFGIRANAVAPAPCAPRPGKRVLRPIPMSSRKPSAGMRCAASPHRKMSPMPSFSWRATRPPPSPAPAFPSIAA